MSTIITYKLLKTNGTLTDRLKYVLSILDTTELEKYLNQSSSSCDDLQMLICLSKAKKNEKQLLEIFKTDSFPIRQRTIAGKRWIKLQKDEKQIFDFIVEAMNNKHIPQFFKNQILKDLHKIDCLKKSSSFFYNLACCLTESYRHDRYNLDAYLVPFCSKDQVLNLLSRWSIKGFEQIESSPLFRSKLIHYQPLIVIHLIQCDLNQSKINNEKFSNYFQTSNHILSLLSKKEPKAIIHLTIEYMNQFEQHRRLLPYFIQSKQTYFFKKVPDDMIKLITIVAAYQSGIIKYQRYWNDDGLDIDAFTFPRSFSINHYVRLFFTLYDTCKWSSNYTIQILQYMLKNNKQHVGLYSSRKRRKWLLDVVIHKRIGREIFIQKLLNEGNEKTLQLFEEYPEITTPLSLHLISQYEIKQTLGIKQCLSLIRYQSMTRNIFDQFLTLFNQTNSNIKQREQNYIIFLQCAVSTNGEQVKNVLQWIQKSFRNEQLSIIETFLCSLSEYNNQFQLEILPNNFEIIESIIEIAVCHLKKTTYTLQIIVNYAILLLQRVEYHPNKQERDRVQTFACKVIKQCLITNNILEFHVSSLSEPYPRANHLIADILISDVFSKLLSKCMIDELNDAISAYLQKPWQILSIDSFLHSFFTHHLPFSKELQAVFQIDKHISLISLFLKNRLTQFERASHLINKIDKIFLINDTVQQIILRSQQHRPLIDKLIEDDRCLTLEKLSNEATELARKLDSKTKNIKMPGLNINVLNCSFHELTGKQQEHIAKIILYDYIQNDEVTNLNKLKSLRVLHRLTQAYDQSLPWIDKKQNYSLALKSNSSADVNSLDHIIICVPVKFNLTTQDLLKQFDFLKTKLNASNAKYISDAMLMISRKISPKIFLERYVEFLHNEQFQKLGITANKEILRLLIEHSTDSNLIKSIIKPLWDSRPHQDVRACLILTALHFIDKLHSDDDKIIMWKILEEAADDTYLPVVKSLFSADRGTSRWSLSRLLDSHDDIIESFINRIQFRILDHPTSLEARLWAWSNIDWEHCDLHRLIEKGQKLCIQFNRDANILWEHAFKIIVSICKNSAISSSDMINNIITKLMSRREEIDSKNNSINNRHDLPVYHRISHILTNLVNHINQFHNEIKVSFRSLAASILQFEKTFAFLIGTLLIRIAESRYDLESMIILFQENLSQSYFENILIRLSAVISNKHSPSFIQKLNVHEKLELSQWFIEEKDQGLLVFHLLKSHVFNKYDADRKTCQSLLRRMRQSENLFLKQQALEYTVHWKIKKEKNQQEPNKIRAPKNSSDAEQLDMDLFDIFDTANR